MKTIATVLMTVMVGCGQVEKGLDTVYLEPGYPAEAHVNKSAVLSNGDKVLLDANRKVMLPNVIMDESAKGWVEFELEQDGNKVGLCYEAKGGGFYRSFFYINDMAGCEAVANDSSFTKWEMTTAELTVYNGTTITFKAPPNVKVELMSSPEEY